MHFYLELELGHGKLVLVQQLELERDILVLGHGILELELELVLGHGKLGLGRLLELGRGRLKLKNCKRFI